MSVAPRAPGPSSPSRPPPPSARGEPTILAEARRRQTAIEPRLARLSIRVVQELPGLVLQRDGKDLDRGAWGTAVPVDPGQHTVSAQAPGHAAWSGMASVTDPGKTVTLDVPELLSTSEPPPPVTTPPSAAAAPEIATSSSYWTGRRVASASLTGVGVLGLVASGVLVGVAKAKDNSAQTEPSNRGADSSSAVNLGNVATIVGGAGLAVAATGLLLWLTAPDAQVQVGTTGTGFVLGGRF